MLSLPGPVGFRHLQEKHGLECALAGAKAELSDAQDPRLAELTSQLQGSQAEVLRLCDELRVTKV